MNFKKHALFNYIPYESSHAAFNHIYSDKNNLVSNTEQEYCSLYATVDIAKL